MRHGNGPRPVRDVLPVQTPQSPWSKQHGRLKPNHGRQFLASCLAQPRCRRSRPSPRAIPLDATPVPARVERLGSYGRDPAHAPRRTPRGQFRTAAWPFAGLPLQSLWHRRRSRTRDPQKGPTVAARSRPCDRWCCDKRPRSCSSARCRPRLVAPKKDLIESQGLDLRCALLVEHLQDRSGPFRLGFDPTAYG